MSERCCVSLVTFIEDVVGGVIDKQAYYRGAAIFQLIEDERMENVRRVRPGFIVNDHIFVLVKYTAKVASPWQFTFSEAERDAIEEHRGTLEVVLALVCGGDGICALRWDDVEPILDAPPTWVSASRKVNKRYRVTGSNGEMRRRVPRNNWPGMVFDGKVATQNGFKTTD